MVIPSDRQTEAAVAYWQSRVASLESIVCELLADNQRLRSAQSTKPSAPAGVYPHGLTTDNAVRY